MEPYNQWIILWNFYLINKLGSLLHSTMHLNIMNLSKIAAHFLVQVWFMLEKMRFSFLVCVKLAKDDVSLECT